MLQLAHYMSNVIAPGAPDAALVSRTNYSSCIPSCTVGVVCCLRSRSGSAQSWSWSGGRCCITVGCMSGTGLRSHQQGGFSPWQMLFRSIVMTTESRNSISCPCYSRCWERIASQHSICWFVFVGAADVLDSMLYTWCSFCKHWILGISLYLFRFFSENLEGVSLVLSFWLVCCCGGWFLFSPRPLDLEALLWWQSDQPEGSGTLFWELSMSC